MASDVQDITCVFVEVAGSYEKTSNLTVSWDGVYSPPVECLGEAHRRLKLFTII